MLNTLMVEDPYEMANSDGLVEYLASETVTCNGGFSIDVKDLYSSLPHDSLMQCVRECITEENDEVVFQNTCGMTVESFLELLHFYINNTHIGFCDKTFLQTKGVSIGSKVAPVLSNIFLSTVDRQLFRHLDGVVSNVFRFVDDYLVLGCKCETMAFKERVLDTFILRRKKVTIYCGSSCGQQVEVSGCTVEI